MTPLGTLPRCPSCPDVMVYANHACHGTRTRYQARCRCADCRQANSIYKRNYMSAVAMAADPGARRAPSSSGPAAIGTAGLSAAFPSRGVAGVPASAGAGGPSSRT